MLVPLGVAGLLRPAPQGHGTHQQLGLPPCTFLVLFGKPCPSCGMTTAWANLVHGHLGAALRTHVTGTVLAVLDLAGAVWLLAVACRGRWVGGVPNSTAGSRLASVIVAVTLIEWVLRLLAV